MLKTGVCPASGSLATTVVTAVVFSAMLAVAVSPLPDVISGALFGPTSAVLAHRFGSSGGIGVGAAVLTAETLLPLLLALHVFRRRDA